MDQPFLGTIVPMAINFAPRGWMSCEGQILPIQQYAALFSLLGTNYGGNGTSTFALPDLRGRMSIGQGNGPGLPQYVVGENGGGTSVTLIAAQMPVHNHPISTKANAFSATSSDPSNNYFGGSGPNIYDSGTDSTALNPACITATPIGANQPIGIANPFLGLYYNIAIEGLFPSRN